MKSSKARHLMKKELYMEAAGSRWITAASKDWLTARALLRRADH